MTNHAILAILLSFMLLGTGCLGHQPAGNSSVPGPGGTPGGAYPVTPAIHGLENRSLPSAVIVDPPFDGGIYAGNVTITVQVKNFTLAPQDNESGIGTGRLVYYRDVVPPVTRGVPALTYPGSYAVSQNTTYQWSDIAPGTHTFAVQLVNNDNTPLVPPVLDAVDVTAVLPGMIQSPGQGMDLF